MLFQLVLWLSGIAVLGAIAVSTCIGFVALHKYNKLMAYLREHHPDAYAQARPKPIWRHFYLRGADTHALNKFAAHHEPLNDPTAEALLADCVQFYHRANLIVLFFFFGISLCFWGMCGPLNPLNPSGPFASIWSFLSRLVP